MSTAGQRRPRNAQATREAIIEAARLRFANNAYEQVSLREIASAVGVDPSLVIRYFGSKESLFEHVLTSRVLGPDDAELLGDRASFGRRLAAAHIEHDSASAHHETINTAIWSAASPVAAKIVARDVEERFVEPIARALEGEDAEIRASLIVAILMGSSIMRNMLMVKPLAGPDMSPAAPYLAAVLQRLADGD
jgi:AcrR family transcriptional regulator